jgi:hypothetical protein
VPVAEEPAQSTSSFSCLADYLLAAAPYNRSLALEKRQSGCRQVLPMPGLFPEIHSPQKIHFPSKI